MRKTLKMIGLIAGSMSQGVLTGSENPDFGPQVIIFEPGQDGMQERIRDIFKKQESAQFGTERYALLFKPGTYDLDVPVGFYTHVAGLGRLPGDVEINGAVRATAAWMGYNATCNFWRAAENFTVIPAKGEKTITWSVSQAAPLRRAHFKSNLNVSERGWSSGGFLADCKIDGTVSSGSQQQWFSRNSTWGRWGGGVWNMVFLGCSNAPRSSWPHPPHTVIDSTPLRREKPYLVFDQKDGYQLVVPPLQKTASQGPSWEGGQDPGISIPINQFHLARPGDSAQDLNKALAEGKHLLFTPGIYELGDTLRVSRPGTIIFGLGLPTLIPTTGKPAMVVDAGEDVIVAGMVYDAGSVSSEVLLRIGEPGRRAGNPDKPICLMDVFSRVGGPSVGTTECMVQIYDDHVFADHFWLWRADHGAGAKWDINRNKNGLIVEGDHVTIYGLFVEHCHEYQTIWNGNHGRMIFYQSEMPYDPPSQEEWMNGVTKGFASYKVGEKVTDHEAWGLGIYCVFRNDGVTADRAIEAPDLPGVKIQRMVTINLSGGKDRTGIKHIINDRGDAVIGKMRSVLD